MEIAKNVFEFETFPSSLENIKFCKQLKIPIKILKILSFPGMPLSDFPSKKPPLYQPETALSKIKSEHLKEKEKAFFYFTYSLFPFLVI